MIEITFEDENGNISRKQYNSWWAACNDCADSEGVPHPDVYMAELKSIPKPQIGNGNTTLASFTYDELHAKFREMIEEEKTPLDERKEWGTYQ